jgi:hypothetical protein
MSIIAGYKGDGFGYICTAFRPVEELIVLFIIVNSSIIYKVLSCYQYARGGTGLFQQPVGRSRTRVA